MLGRGRCDKEPRQKLYCVSHFPAHPLRPPPVLSHPCVAAPLPFWFHARSDDFKRSLVAASCREFEVGRVHYPARCRCFDQVLTVADWPNHLAIRKGVRIASSREQIQSLLLRNVEWTTLTTSKKRYRFVFP